MPDRLDRWGELLEADAGDVFDRRDHAALVLVEPVAIGVEELVVERLDQGRVHRVLDRKLGIEAIQRIGRDADAGLDLVVVSVPAGVVALAKELGVLLIAECGCVQSMGGREVEALSDQDRVVCSGCGVHLNPIVRRERPPNERE